MFYVPYIAIIGDDAEPIENLKNIHILLSSLLTCQSSHKLNATLMHFAALRSE